MKPPKSMLKKTQKEGKGPKHVSILNPSIKFYPKSYTYEREDDQRKCWAKPVGTKLIKSRRELPKDVLWFTSIDAERNRHEVREEFNRTVITGCCRVGVASEPSSSSRSRLV